MQGEQKSYSENTTFKNGVERQHIALYLLPNVPYRSVSLNDLFGYAKESASVNNHLKLGVATSLFVVCSSNTWEYILLIALRKLHLSLELQNLLKPCMKVLILFMEPR